MLSTSVYSKENDSCNKDQHLDSGIKARARGWHPEIAFNVRTIWKRVDASIVDDVESTPGTQRTKFEFEVCVQCVSWCLLAK